MNDKLSSVKERSHVVLVNLSHIQTLRHLLELQGYTESNKRVKKLDKETAAIPVTENFVKFIAKQNNLKCNEKDRHALTDKISNQDLYNKVFNFSGVQFQIDSITLEPSKKTKILSPCDILGRDLKDLVKNSQKDLKNEDLEKLWWENLQKDLPKSWEKHGDLILLSESCFTHTLWAQLSGVWHTVVNSLGGSRLAKKSIITQNGYRTPQVQLLLGKDGWVTHVDNSVKYTYDVTRCMFSAGNVTEKLRVAKMDCSGETVVDLYAGIGYFTLPYLVHAGAAHVHACEWNPDAVEALKKNLVLNNVGHKCNVHQGDNRNLTLVGIADRVNLGLIPSSEAGWSVACRLLRPDTGGMLHVHANVTSCSKYIGQALNNIALSTNEHETSTMDLPTNKHDTSTMDLPRNEHKTSTMDLPRNEHETSTMDLPRNEHETSTMNLPTNKPEETKESKETDLSLVSDNMMDSNNYTANKTKTMSCVSNVKNQISDNSNLDINTIENKLNDTDSNLDTSADMNTGNEVDHINCSSDTNTSAISCSPHFTVCNTSQNHPSLEGVHSSLAEVGVIPQDSSVPQPFKNSRDIKYTNYSMLNDTEYKKLETVNKTRNKSCEISRKHKKNTNKFVKSTEVKPSWHEWAHCTKDTIRDMLTETHYGQAWEVSVVHIEHVKSYAPHVDHLVLDLLCKPKELCSSK